MSMFTGKCDFYDNLMMRHFKDEDNCLESDDLKCFNDFKEKTNGVIYQFIDVELNNDNIEKECSLTKLHVFPLERFKHKKIVKDKRFKSGEKEVTFYTYKYNNKDYNTLDEINKEHYFRYKEIKFDTIFDLVPYFPYLISIQTYSKDKEFVVLSSESYIDTQEELYLKYGLDTKFLDNERKALQDYYLELFKKYYKN